MDKSRIESYVIDFIHSRENLIASRVARESKLIGVRMFDEPLFAYGNAQDTRFAELRDNPEAQMPLMLPPEWLPSAKSVVCCFLPVSQEVRTGNRRGTSPSWGWLHARIEGHAALCSMARGMCDLLQQEGYEALCPTLDERFSPRKAATAGEPFTTTNWSERHVGHLCGLGTFSLSKGLITEKGVAGRIISVVTSLELEPTVPRYSGLLDYCSACGRCAKNCPVGALHEFHQKDDRLCSGFLDEVFDSNHPYYGCGKCQVAVPCESQIP